MKTIIVHKQQLTPQQQAIVQGIHGILGGIIATSLYQMPDVWAGRAHFNVLEVCVLSALSCLFFAASELWFADPAGSLAAADRDPLAKELKQTSNDMAQAAKNEIEHPAQVP